MNLSVYDLILEPLPFKISSAMILMTLDCHEPTWVRFPHRQLPFIKYDVNQSDNLSQKVLEYTMKNEKVWASPTISVPPLKSDHASLVCKFPLLKSMLNRNITFYLMTRDESIPTNHPLPNTVVGQTEICDLQLKTLL